MKKASKFLWVLLALLAAAALAISCDNGTTKDEPQGPEGGDEPLGKFSDWSIVLGWNNEYDGAVDVAEAQDGGKTVLKADWGSHVYWGGVSCELIAQLPEGVAYNEYDGITFEIKGLAQIFIAIRRQGQGNAWKLDWEKYTKDLGATADDWFKLTIPFEGAADAGWGEPVFEESSINDWLENNANNVKLLFINLMQSGEGSMGEAGDAQVAYFRNVGFYKGADPDAPTATEIIWYPVE
ncbi:MAG: hypothetical protein FWH38_08525 [Treponema sp.]|nr:hypothetical protein [Treponema sp.]